MSGMMLIRATRLKFLCGSITSAVPSQLLPTKTTSRTPGRGEAGDAESAASPNTATAIAVALFASEAEITVLEPSRPGCLKIGVIISASAAVGRRSDQRKLAGVKRL